MRIDAKLAGRTLQRSGASSSRGIIPRHPIRARHTVLKEDFRVTHIALHVHHADFDDPHAGVYGVTVALYVPIFGLYVADVEGDGACVDATGRIVEGDGVIGGGNDASGEAQAISLRATVTSLRATAPSLRATLRSLISTSATSPPMIGAQKPARHSFMTPNITYNSCETNRLHERRVGEAIAKPTIAT